MSYAIIFDLDKTALEYYLPDGWTNTFGEIRQTLESFGFAFQQGGFYLGNSEIDAVKCVLAAQHLSNKFPWFKASVKNLRMLRIEEIITLSGAL